MGEGTLGRMAARSGFSRCGIHPWFQPVQGRVLISPQDITALVLAGGRGRRMGGRDKGLLPFGEDLLIERVLDQVAPQVGQMLISANRNREVHAAFGYPVLEDPLEDFQGPLAGILAGLRYMDTPYLLTLPVDAPVVPADLAGRLATGIADASADVAFAHDGARLQPVYALMHRRVLPALEQALGVGERQVWRWYLTLDWISVDFSDVSDQFRNINTPADYASVAESRKGD